MICQDRLGGSITKTHNRCGVLERREFGPVAPFVLPVFEWFLHGCVLTLDLILDLIDIRSKMPLNSLSKWI